MDYVILASGIYLVGGAFIMNTSNIQSGVLLRAIPGLIGVGLMLNGARALGLI